MERTQKGYDEACKAIAEGTAVPHALWILVSDEHQRDAYCLKPSPWEGPGEYQRVTFGDGEADSRLIRLPENARSLHKIARKAAAAEELRTNG